MVQARQADRWNRQLSSSPHGLHDSGQMTIRMDDGEELTYGPGDFMVTPPGHDAWIVGDELCVVIDWQGFADYAKAH